jgi:hypothetical protein
MRIPIIPEWTKGLPVSTMLFSCDIMEFFEYNGKSSEMVSGLVRDGLLPTPASFNKFKLQGNKRATKKYWLLGDIKKLRASMLDKEQHVM